MKFTSTDSFTTKYRPKKLSDIVGQPEAVAQIKGILKTKKVPNVILISGSTGSGKTTLARLIAAKINDVEVDEPCNDILEFPIGEMRGIEQVKQIIKQSLFMPKNNFRVLILDEIQQATPQAASALLKPLEDCPPNTVWILATDQPEKVLSTIQGRALKLNLRMPEPPDLIPMLQRVCKCEKIDFGKSHASILERIAESAFGQPRNALTLLQSVYNAFSAGDDAKSAISNVEKSILNVGNEKIAIKLLICLYSAKPVAIVNTFNDFTSKEFIGLLSLMLDYNQFIIYHISSTNTYVSPARRMLLDYLQKNKLPSINTCCLIHNVLVDLKKEMGTFLVPEQHLVLARLLNATLEKG